MSVKVRALSLSLALSVHLPSQETAARLVQQLQNASLRQSASSALVSLGETSVPPLLDAWRAGSDDVEYVRAVLGVLRELGPTAGSVFGELIEKQERIKPDLVEEFVHTAGQLAPYRPDPDREQGPKYHRQFGDLLRQALELNPASVHRFEIRYRFPADAPIELLIQVAREKHAFRRELAIELLGHRGSEAKAAVPVLMKVLEQPDPRVATASPGVVGVVPLRQTAARSLLAISPGSESARLACAVLDGSAQRPRRPAVATLPKRAQARVERLLRDLEQDRLRAAATANLVAYGSAAVPALLNELEQEHSTAFRQAALHVIQQLGPQAADFAPELLPFAWRLPTDNTPDVIDALTATAPWSCDVVPLVGWGCRGSKLLRINGRLVGNASPQALNALVKSMERWFAAARIDVNTPLSELTDYLSDSNARYRERAFTILESMGSRAKPALAAIENAMTSEHPRWSYVRFDEGKSLTGFEDSTPHLRMLAARAVLAITPDGPIADQARRLIQENKDR